MTVWILIIFFQNVTDFNKLAPNLSKANNVFQLFTQILLKNKITYI